MNTLSRTLLSAVPCILLACDVPEDPTTPAAADEASPESAAADEAAPGSPDLDGPELLQDTPEDPDEALLCILCVLGGNKPACGADGHSHANACFAACEGGGVVPPVAYYPDADGDGFGDASAAPASACTAPAGASLNDDDCDDGDDTVSPTSPELCDGVDNDCDALVDEDKVCAAGTCTGGGGSCVELPISPPVPLVSGCAQQFPPAATLPCPIEEPGQVFHVSADTGDDNNDGLTPDTAWRSLCKAVDAAAEGSTVRVAEGQYATAEVYIGKELTLKGGFDATFTDWDPDAHQSVFHGRLTLDHNYAVFGGFRMISNPLFADSWSYGHHFIFAGTLVRNYVEIVAGSGQDPDILNFYGILPTACPDGVSVLRCNDVYVRSDAPQTFVVSAIEYGNQALLAGKGVLDANRICQEGGSFATDAVGGYGSCFPQDVSLLLRNNVIEKVGTGNALDFYSCGEGDMDLTLTNNTILSGGAGIQADGDPVVMMRWKLTNNIVFSGGGGSSAIDVGGAGVEITTSEHNLTFGFQSNAILPAPLMSANDDTSGVATQASVFVDANAGDFHPKPGGEAAGTGLNVFSLPDYGAVTQDLGQSLRPPQGEWDRGALRQ